MNPNISGMNIIIFCCAGSPPGCGVIFCMMNCVAIMAMGRMWMGMVSCCERSVTHSQLAPRISMAMENTL